MNWFDVFILVALIVSLVKGFFVGLVMQIASLLGFVASAVFAGQFAAFLSPWFLNATGVSPHIVQPLSYVIAFLLIIIAFLFVGKVLHGFLKMIKLDALNRMAGAFFCVFEFVVIISIVLNVVIALDQNSRLIKTEIREHSYTYKYVKAVAPAFVPFLRFNFAVVHVA